MRCQDASLDALNAILHTEQIITGEVRQLLELKAYPSAELAIIRKEIKSFKDHQEVMLQSKQNSENNINNSASSSSTADMSTIDNQQKQKSDNTNNNGIIGAASNDALASSNHSNSSISLHAVSSSSISETSITGYEELLNILLAENKLCERKFAMLNNRRQEEEERRAIVMKKLAKLKAVNESQAKDPANFRNQRF